MSEKLRILITGFGPFPGAPFNPTQPLVARLLRLRRPALGDLELSGHIFPVTYQAVDRALPDLLSRRRPQALLMFGLAARRMCGLRPARVTQSRHCGPMPITRACARDRSPAAPTP
jgi:pyrrolidone-carboxylate peptidase